MNELKVNDIKKVVVVGSGLMGSQIGELMARLGGYWVTLVDVMDDLVNKGLGAIDQRTEKFFVAKGKMTLMVRAGYPGGAGKKGIYDFYQEVLSKW